MRGRKGITRLINSVGALNPNEFGNNQIKSACIKAPLPSSFSFSLSFPPFCLLQHNRSERYIGLTGPLPPFTKTPSPLLHRPNTSHCEQRRQKRATFAICGSQISVAFAESRGRPDDDASRRRMGREERAREMATAYRFS